MCSSSSDPHCKSSDEFTGFLIHLPQVNHVDGLVDCDDSKLLHLAKQEDHGLVHTLQQVKLSLLNRLTTVIERLRFNPWQDSHIVSLVQVCRLHRPEMCHRL